MKFFKTLINICLSLILFSSNAAAQVDPEQRYPCLLYTSDAADERSSVDLGGRRIIKKKKRQKTISNSETHTLNTQIIRS